MSREGVTVFGTSPAYLQYCRDAHRARERVDLSALRAMQSTGSILFDNQYDWVRDNVKALPLHPSPAARTSSGASCWATPTCPSTAARASA